MKSVSVHNTVEVELTVVAKTGSHFKRKSDYLYAAF